MTKRVKKRFTSDVNVIDFHTPVSVKKKRVSLLPRNKNQESYVMKLNDENNSIIFAIGPAGTGKSMLAMQMAIKSFQEGKVDKIIITRPAVSADEDLGFLPGTMNEKMLPWVRPLIDILEEHYSLKDVTTMLENGVVEISPLAYMRGRTFKHAFIIADEMQNATNSQMKMLLTRIGDGSRMVVTGDLNQADRPSENGLLDFCKLYEKAAQAQLIDIAWFDSRDIERHPAVTEVLRIYGDC